MSSYLKKKSFVKLLGIVGIVSLTLSFVSLTYANSFFQRGEEDTTLDKVTTFTTQLNAEGGKLNTINIHKEEGEGPIMLDKAYVFVDDGLNAGNVHLHNVKVDGVLIAHFAGGELPYVKAGDSEEDTKIRGGELTRILHEFMNSDDLVILANDSIEFDFMAASSNDPNPTPVSVMVHVKSSHDADIHIGLVE